MVAGEILGCTLLTIHNLAFYLDLMAQARAHIEAGDYASWRLAWVKRYEDGAAAR
jgi:queuine tRNA-ribosyltransferase